MDESLICPRANVDSDEQGVNGNGIRWPGRASRGGGGYHTQGLKQQGHCRKDRGSCSSRPHDSCPPSRREYRAGTRRDLLRGGGGSSRLGRSSTQSPLRLAYERDSLGLGQAAAAAARPRENRGNVGRPVVLGRSARRGWRGEREAQAGKAVKAGRQAGRLQRRRRDKRERDRMKMLRPKCRGRDGN